MALVVFLPRPESQYISQYIYWVPRKITLKSPKWHWLILPRIGAYGYFKIGWWDFFWTIANKFPEWYVPALWSFPDAIKCLVTHLRNRDKLGAGLGTTPKFIAYVKIMHQNWIWVDTFVAIKETIVTLPLRYRIRFWAFWTQKVGFFFLLA